MPERIAWPQDHSVAIQMEGAGATNWGTAPAGAALRTPVEPGSWLNDVVDEFRDENVRNAPVRDFNSLAVVSHGEGRLMGNFYPIITPYFIAAMMGKETLVSSEPTITLKRHDGTSSGDSSFYAHEFVVSEVPRSFAIQQSVTAQELGSTDVIPKQLMLGMYPSTFTLRWNAGEGAITWECDFIGKGQVWPTTPKIEADYEIDSSETLPATQVEADDGTFGNRVPRPMLGPEVRVAVSNGGTLAAYGFVTEGEIVLSREITLHYSSGGSAGGTSGYRPTRIGVKPLRATFNVTAHLIAASDDGDTGTTTTQFDLASLRDYSNSQPSAANAQTTAVKHQDSASDLHFGSKENQNSWLFRFTTPKDITATTAPTPEVAFTSTLIGAAATSGGDTLGNKLSASTANTEDDAVMDILFEKVSYGEGTMEVDRSGDLTTFQIRAVAVYDKSQSAETGIGRIRVYNQKNNTYFPTGTGATPATDHAQKLLRNDT